MTEIIPVNYRTDILPEYQGTPAGQLLEYHNLDRALGSGPGRQLLIGMCMDSRKSLRIPPDFAYVLRTAGANMRDNEFRISFAIAVGGVIPAAANRSSIVTPSHFVSNFDHLVTQWMSRCMGVRGSASNSAQLQLASGRGP